MNFKKIFHSYIKLKSCDILFDLLAFEATDKKPPFGLHEGVFCSFFVQCICTCSKLSGFKGMKKCPEKFYTCSISYKNLKFEIWNQLDHKYRS